MHLVILCLLFSYLDQRKRNTSVSLLYLVVRLVFLVVSFLIKIIDTRNTKECLFYLFVHLVFLCLLFSYRTRDKRTQEQTWSILSNTWCSFDFSFPILVRNKKGTRVNLHYLVVHLVILCLLFSDLDLRHKNSGVSLIFLIVHLVFLCHLCLLFSSLLFCLN